MLILHCFGLNINFFIQGSVSNPTCFVGNLTDVAVQQCSREAHSLPEDSQGAEEQEGSPLDAPILLPHQGGLSHLVQPLQQPCWN